MKNKKDKILVLGYLGLETNQLDGQTIKTRNIYSLLKSKEHTNFKEVKYFDTQNFQNDKWNVIRMFKNIYKTDILFYLPAQNNLKFIFPFVFIFCALIKTPIHYIVVGGWLAKFLERKKMHQWMLEKVTAIYPQTNRLSEDLRKKYGFDNVCQLNNFRMLNAHSPAKISNGNVIKLVFMARIHPLKGVETVFKLAEALENSSLKDVEIDMFGPIFSEYENDFRILLSNQINIKYKGPLQPENINTTLQHYDLMLFPTQYYTEGFPGSILDAYNAHIPVIVTAWRYAHEFIEDSKSGIIVEFGNTEEFVARTIQLINTPSLLQTLKEGARTQSYNYSSDHAWNIIKEKI